MSKTFSLSYLLILLLTCFSFSNCSTKQGCTDPDSIQFDASADEDDGSCKYEGSVVFWFDANTSIFLNNNYIHYIDVFVNDSLIGGLVANSSYLNPPECNQGGVTYYEYLGVEKQDFISFEIRYTDLGGTDRVYTSGNVMVEGGKCTPFKIQ